MGGNVNWRNSLNVGHKNKVDKWIDDGNSLSLLEIIQGLFCKNIRNEKINIEENR